MNATSPLRTAIRSLVAPLAQSWERHKNKPRIESISLKRLLQGGECGVRGTHYARLVGDVWRGSRTIEHWPHTLLLKEYQRAGDSVLEPAAFRQSLYYQNAMQAIEYTGQYFSARDEEGVLKIAQGFIARFRGETPPPPSEAHTPAGREFIITRPIEHSAFHEVVDGHHRAAIAWVRGEKSLPARFTYHAVKTPMMETVMDVLWQSYRAELYQPVDAPEFGDWHVMRRCSDRLEMMKRKLGELGIDRGTYRDLACSYGWFVSNMGKAGFDSAGVELDPFAIRVGRVAYGLPDNAVVRSDLVRWLRGGPEKTDIVSCFSLLHHFVLGRGACSAEELISMIDAATGSILFLDTGEAHEEWFRESLAEWSPDYIRDWLGKHTTFRKIIALGTDADNRPPHAANYRRTLFACIR